MWPALGIFGPAREVCTIFDPPLEAANPKAPDPFTSTSIACSKFHSVSMIKKFNKENRKCHMESFTNLKPGQFGKAPFGSEAVKSFSQTCTMSPSPSESSWPILTGMLAIVTSMCTALCHLWLGHMAHPIHQVLRCHHVLARKIWPTRLPFERRFSIVKFKVLFLEMVTVLCSALWTLRQSVQNLIPQTLANICLRLNTLACDSYQLSKPFPKENARNGQSKPLNLTGIFLQGSLASHVFSPILLPFRHMCFISSSRGSGNFSNSAGSRNGAPSVGEGLHKTNATQWPNLWIDLLGLLKAPNVCLLYISMCLWNMPRLGIPNLLVPISAQSLEVVVGSPFGKTKWRSAKEISWNLILIHDRWF